MRLRRKMRKMDIVDRGRFEFTRNWFLSRNGDTFRRYVHPEWSGRQNLLYLEIGCWEGMSLVWMMQRVLTDLTCRAVGVDPWLMTTKVSGEAMEEVMRRARRNLSEWTGSTALGRSAEKRCTLIRGNSAEVLRRMVGRKGYVGVGPGTVDLAMVDGNHNALGVLDDLLLTYKLLKPGGWIMCDDVENDIPKADHVKEGLSMFLSRQPMEFVFKHRYMECYRK